MKIKIIAFGSITAIMGKEICLHATDIVSMKEALEQLFPELSDRKYAVAVNMKLAGTNVLFGQNDTVALMPPYSGG
ncbi:molybdopterin synthase sulfur carrier subunit [Flavobacterium sp. ZB4P23]|uniref:MoaD/ThiS family protein n=1 Tax=unclassified Flavobacterium TaxID=196869 RepID=UPI000F81CC5F|nr:MULTISPECIES: MoaD/ThiS family protein [unclassified Flavobacterium]RTY84507.1 molybdopterin synthase sulfur carrier subunit [Flavobacterium sp. ZB4P23]RTZ05825.1 molybdopterin synthase sulfur carrier subunit [Flavobacterium sp. GSP6]